MHNLLNVVIYLPFSTKRIIPGVSLLEVNKVSKIICHNLKHVTIADAFMYLYQLFVKRRALIVPRTRNQTRREHQRLKFLVRNGVHRKATGVLLHKLLKIMKQLKVKSVSARDIIFDKIQIEAPVFYERPQSFYTPKQSCITFVLKHRFDMNPVGL